MKIKGYCRSALVPMLLAVCALASAQTTHDAYLDLDANPATGCSVVTPAGTVTGAEVRLRATVDGDPPLVQTVTQAQCAGGVFGAAQAQPAGYPAGLNLGTDGADVVEFSTALSALGEGGPARLILVSHQASGADWVEASVALPGTSEPPAVQPSAVIPATGWAALALLLVGVVLLVRRHPAFGSALAVVVMMGAGVAWAANFVADGQVLDWSGVSPAATDPANDATDGSASVDIVALFAATEAGRLHVRADLRDLEPSANQAPSLAPAAFTLDENSAAGNIVGSVTGTDPDAGQTLSYAITAGNTGNAFAIDAATGEITVANAAALDAEATPVFNLSVTATDDGDPVLSTTATVTITLGDVNEAPSVADQAFAVVENAAAGTSVGAVAATDPDASAPNATLTYAITAGNTGNAFAIDPASGTITVLTSAAIVLGSDFALTVQVSDGGTPALSDSATVTITVTDQNDAPVFGQPAYAFGIAEHTAAGSAVGVVGATDPDVGQTLTYAIASGNTGNAFAIDPATGAISVADPAPLDFETTPVFNLTVSATDDGLPPLAGTATVTITLADANDAPVADDLAFSVPENAAVATVVGSATASDEDAAAPNDTLSFAITAGDPDGVFAIDANSGAISVANGALIDFETNTVFVLTVTVTDGGGLSDTGDVTITPTDVNEAPSLADSTRSVVENAPIGTAVGAPVMGSDPDTTAPDNTLGYAITNGNTNGAFAIDANSGQITVAAPAALVVGTSFILELTVTDGGGLTGTGNVTVDVTDVNDAPSFDAGPDQASLEDGGPQTIANWATNIDDNDPGTQTLTFVVTHDNPALFATAPAIDAFGTLTYEAAPDANGSAQVTVVLTDDGGTALGGVDTSASQTFTLTVTPVNDAPLFTAGAAVSVLENASAQTLPGWATGIVAGPSDESAQTLTFVVTGNTNPALFAVPPAVAADGTLTFTPAADTIGSADVTLTLSDDGGTANGGVDTSAPQIVTITVDNVNDPPSFSLQPDPVVNEDDGSVGIGGFAFNIDDGDAGVMQALSFNVTANTNPALFTTAPTINSASGTMFFVLAPDANGTTQITVALSDDGGTADGGVDTSAPQTFTLTVNAVNDAPTFAAGPAPNVLENAGPQTLPAWATGISAGPPDEAGQTLAFLITSNTNPALFSAGPTVTADGTLSFTPAPNASGSADITLRLSDDGGTVNGGVDLSAPQTVTVAVTDINAAPVFTAGPGQVVSEDAGLQAVPNWASGIDDGDPTVAQTLTFNVIGNSNPALFSTGPAVAADGTLSYTPAADASGTATISLVLSDDGGTANGGSDTSAPQNVTITVDPVNDAPTFSAAGDQTVDEDAGAHTVANWATGMDAGAPDEAGQTLAFAITGNSNPGLFSVAPALDAAGTLTYTPAANTSGTATITVVLSDNGGTANGGVDTSVPVNLTITVNGVNDAPGFVAGSSPIVLEDAGPQTINPWATAIDDGDPDVAQGLSFEILSNDNVALFSAGPAVSASGALTFTPASDASGVANISLRLVDDGGTANGGVNASPAQAFTITVQPVNDAPTATAKNHATHSAIALDILAASHTGELLEGASDVDDATGDLHAELVVGSVVPAGAQVTITDAATGSFRYDPPGGFSGAGGFQFRICDDGVPVAPAQCSAPQTVSINVTGPELWFVDDSAPAGGDGGLTDPFDSLADLPPGRGNGDRIYVFSGNHTGNITLNAGEHLIGQGHGGASATLLGVVTPGNGQLAALPTAAAAPVLGGAVTIGGNDAVLRGLVLSASSGTALSAGAVTGLTVLETSIASSATAVNFNGTGTTAGVTFTSVTSTGGAQGIVLNNLTGAFNFGSGTLSGHSGTAFQAGGTLGITSYAGNMEKTAAGRLIDITGAASGTLTLSGNWNCYTNCGTGGGNSAVRVSGSTGGTIDFSGSNKVLASSAANTAMHLTGNSGATINIGGATRIDTTTGTAFQADNGGTIAINGQFSLVSSGGRVMQVANVSLSGTMTGLIGSAGALGATTPAISIQNSSSTGLTFDQQLVLDHDDAGESGGGIRLVGNTGTYHFDNIARITSSDTTAFHASNAGTISMGRDVPGQLISVGAAVIDVQNTTIAAEDLRVVQASSSGAVSGIVLNTTGSLGGLAVLGNGTAGSGGTIAGTSSHGIALTNTASPYFAHMIVQNTGGDGVSGTRTDGFTFINGTINNSGTGGATNAANIGFNDIAVGNETNLTGTVVITGNTLTNSRFHGVDVFNYNGTIAALDVSSNTFTSSTSAATSQGSAVRLIAYGSATNAANVTRATIANNVINNFPGGAGIVAQAGNANAAGPPGTFGVAGHATNIIAITGNRIAGQSPANRMNAEAIVTSVNGRGQGNFNISNNGTIAEPIRHVTGIGIGASAFGQAQVTATISNNVIAPGNSFAAAGIGGGLGNTWGTGDAPDMTVTVSNNTISQTDGNGILLVARDTRGILRAKVQNNTVAAPLSGVRPGIRIDSGNSLDGDNDTVCLNISGNTSAGSGGTNGIGLRKQGTDPNQFRFAVHGMAATSSPGVETYVGGQNPAGNGVLLISATSGFASCNLP